MKYIEDYNEENHVSKSPITLLNFLRPYLKNQEKVKNEKVEGDIILTEYSDANIHIFDNNYWIKTSELLSIVMHFVQLNINIEDYNELLLTYNLSETYYSIEYILISKKK